MSKAYSIINYGKKYKQALIDLLQDTTVSITIPNEVTTLGQNRWRDDTRLQYIDFNKVEVIPPDTCRECTNLTQAIFSTHTIQIGDNAFYDCIKFEDTELPHTLTNIGQYAFYRAGSNYSRGTHTFTMIDNEGVHTTIGERAFYQSHLSTIQAYTNDIGVYAFAGCSSLTNVDIEIHGTINGYAFNDCSYVENFKINPNSVITGIGNYAFSNLAYYTSSSLKNIAPFDFRNSVFTSIGTSIWTINHDGIIYFPSMLASITGNFLNNAQGNWKLYFSSIPAVSSSSYLRNDISIFTVKYCFPLSLIEQAKQATNWSSHTSQMAAWIDNIPAGEEIQPYTKDTGLAIIWYSDAAMTQVVTVSAGPSNVYYGEIVGSVREAWYINKSLADASVVISDGINNYTNFVPVDTTVVITPSYTDPNKNQLYIFKVNGVDYTSAGTASVVANQNLQISCIYWDGEHQPFFPTLADNSWDMIKLASKLGVIPSTWNVGDTKTLTYNGQTHTVRLVDKTGKFTRTADGSTAYLSFEFETLIEDSYCNNQNRNTITENKILSDMNTGVYWDRMDPDLKNVIEDVDVIVCHGYYEGSVITPPIPLKFFLAREHDIYSERWYSIEQEWNAIVQDEYYQIHDTDVYRRKQFPTSIGYSIYWSMSCDNTPSFIIAIDGNGKRTKLVTSKSNAVAPRFAL